MFDLMMDMRELADRLRAPDIGYGCQFEVLHRPSEWTDLLRVDFKIKGMARQFTIKIPSVIAPFIAGRYPVEGIAWEIRARIRRLEVELDA